jgi:hypothetical protein
VADEGKLQVIPQRMGRPGVAVAVSGSEQLLKPQTERIRAWLDKDHVLAEQSPRAAWPRGTGDLL